MNEEPDSILGQLKSINAQIARQNSLSRMLVIGIIYGIGFFVGSAVIATIVLGLVGPWFGQIAWIREAFQTGLLLLRP